MLFSLQYSSAKSWIESGLKVDAMIGHSFGQIVALCVAGSISLEAALRFISKRALLIRERWSLDPGTMVAVECSRQEVEDVRFRVEEDHHLRVDIACYNGPRSFVLSGNASSIKKAKEECAGFRVTDLLNTHAYHSYEADAIIDDLTAVAQSIEIRVPSIHVETCSKGASWSQFTAQELAQHTRQPVYFHDAVQRLSSRHPSAIWLEAGSATPIVAMARRVLQGSDDSATYLQIDISDSNAKKNISEAVSRLWMSGAGVKYWGFHSASNYRYNAPDLPPYQFETHSQWTNLKTASSVRKHETDDFDLVTRIRGDNGSHEQVFSVKTSTIVFDLAARGHAVAGKGLCLASLYIEMALIGAVKALDGLSQLAPLPHVENLVMNAPLRLDTPPTVFLRLRQLAVQSWEFSIYSPVHHDDQPTEYAKGVISLGLEKDVLLDYRLKLLQKIAPLSRADRILDSGLAQGISGPLVYKVFSDVVDYANYYRGVKRLSVISHEAAGIVAMSAEQSFGQCRTLCDPISLDNFLQVAGIHVNCLSPRSNDVVFMCTAIDEIVFSEAFMSTQPPQRLWHVYSHYEPGSKSSLKNNIFVYDPNSQSIVLAIIGATFKSVPFKSLMRSLSRLSQTTSIRYSKGQNASPAQDSGYQSTTSSTSSGDNTPFKNGHITDDEIPSPVTISPEKGANTGTLDAQTEADSTVSIQNLAQVISRILEIPIHEVRPTSTMDELGIDSLVATELLSDLQKAFDVSVSQTELQNNTDVQHLLRYIRSHRRHDQISSDAAVDASSLERHAVQNTTKHERVEPKVGHKTDVGRTNTLVRHDQAQITRRLFLEAKVNYDRLAEHTGFAGYYDGPFQLQSELVLQYVVEAFSSMGIELEALEQDEKLPPFHWDPRHNKLMPQLMKILEEGGLVERGSGDAVRRTGKQITAETAASLHQKMLKKYPQHVSETNLLYTTGPKLASCLLGTADPLALIFKDANARALLEDVYANAPMFKTGTLLLADYLVSVLESFSHDREIRILELGAGTGGTTSHVVERLASAVRGDQSRLSYMFTDVSPSLVATARRKFSKWGFMQYSVLDIEKEPPTQFLDTYDIVISTNCIHATKDLVRSATNIRKTLRADGVLCLVELTRNLFWFDLVFGLLDGWWLFTDGRQHALASEKLWERDLLSAGFSSVDWTSGASQESSILRVITAWQSKLLPANQIVASEGETPSTKINGYQETRETLTYKRVNDVDLLADIYYPADADDPGRPSRPVGQ